MTRQHSFSTCLFVVCGLALLQACAPQGPKSGTVACAAGGKPCPEGYYCLAATNTCWKNAEGPDASEPPVDVGPSPESGTTMPVDTGSAIDLASPLDSAPKLDSGAEAGDGPVTQDAPAGDGPVTRDTPAGDAAAPEAGPLDAPLPGTDAGPCPANKVSCGGKCIDPPPVGCCSAQDCQGSCVACDANNLCAPLRGADDPTGRCAGTCDATGACKGKRGQACQAVGGGCASGTYCAPEGVCCDTACTGSCEACDLAPGAGTCTVLPAGTAPHQGHAACAAVDPACAGRCEGLAAACAYPTGSCGTPTCASLLYQAAGTCSAGRCLNPAPKACTYACSVAAGGCTGECTPDQLQCSSAGVPQKCSALGTWQDQTACGTGYNCTAGACVCPTAKSVCGSACVDTKTDASNCGTCSHSCLGGNCLLGVCQPVAVTTTFASAPSVFAVDSQYVYYMLVSPSTGRASDTWRVGKTGLGGTGTMVRAGTGYDVGEGVIGNVIFIGQLGTYLSRTIGASADDPMPESSAVLALWKSNVPRYFATMGQDTTTQMSVNWYLPGGTTPTWTYSEYTSGTLPADTVFSFTRFFAGGDSVYWVRRLADTAGNVLGTTGLYTASVSSGSRAQLAGGATLGTMTIVDASSQSLLLKDDAGNIYRIPLPLGLGTSAPTKITTVVMTSTTGYFQGIVEDANGIYWLDGEGTVYRCSASNCEGTKSVLANGQVAAGVGIGFIQDATALYWGITDTDRIMRLAK